ncbi:uncharacterized protein N7482_005993 [Penicillium canariense]|uniref:Uncharacterized protein n=1 Tax=Penicillium canariense TaxID=189055 RepID=A0A9W9I7I7_9EURO|nr:uncharacterized protein N7482_005993 [Penicillium canariense]KAJ5167212.1 hypothetical protein N7482_005993 [Penicillium canariense]
MAIGSCFCGNIRIEYNGQPTASISLEAQKKWQNHRIVEILSGIISVLTVVCVIRLDLRRQYLMKVIGTPLFGRKINSDGEPDKITVVRAGIFDTQLLNEWKPEAELYTERRLPWLSPIEGAAQISGMLQLS